MTREIFVSEQHPVSRRWAIFEDDGVSGWLYLTEPDSSKPIADCWIYNRIAAPPSSEIKKYRGGPPPASSEFAGSEALIDDANQSDMKFVWSQGGESVAFLMNGKAVGFIVTGVRQGFSRKLKKTGPWGHAWDPRRYKSAFVSKK